MQVNRLADGNGAFLASAGENWSHLATSHRTQSACGESPVAEGMWGLCLAGDKYGDMWGPGIWPLLTEESYVLCLEFEATFG